MRSNQAHHCNSYSLNNNYYQPPIIKLDWSIHRLPYQYFLIGVIKTLLQFVKHLVFALDWFELNCLDMCIINEYAG